jgi:hypothetical protein
LVCSKRDESIFAKGEKIGVIQEIYIFLGKYCRIGALSGNSSPSPYHLYTMEEKGSPNHETQTPCTPFCCALALFTRYALLCTIIELNQNKYCGLNY